MEVSHFLSLIDSLCVVNVLYAEFSDRTFLQQNKLSFTVHSLTLGQMLEMVFGYEYEYLTSLSDGHYKSMCSVYTFNGS